VIAGGGSLKKVKKGTQLFLTCKAVPVIIARARVNLGRLREGIRLAIRFSGLASMKTTFPFQSVRPLAIVVAVLLLATCHSAFATPIVSESFDYGTASAEIQTVSTYDAAGSNVLFYASDVNLTHPMVGGEIAGSFSEEADDAGVRAATRTDVSFAYGDLAAGDEAWFSALLQYNSLDEATVMFGADHIVSPLGFGTDSSGNLLLHYWDSAPNEFTVDDTGLDLAADGSTYLMVVRAVKGTGSGQWEPTNSVVDIWLDPALADLEGAGDYTSRDSKWGRTGTSINSLLVDSGIRNHLDEIRAGTEVADLALVPEPSTVLLLLLAALTLLIRRLWA